MEPFVKYPEVEPMIWKGVELRNGNFTSSEIVALTTMNKGRTAPGVPYYTYIQECNMERRLQRSLTDEINAKPTLWGGLNENRVNNLLKDSGYKFSAKHTIQHPSIKCWVGSPDFTRHFEESHLDAVVDVKCPHTLKSFCELVDAGNNGGIEAIRKTKYGEKYYWQLVSNSCITGLKYAELIVYAPYKSELDAIRQMCDGNPKYYWIQFSQDDELPYLMEGGHYKNLNVFRFIVNPKDKLFLHSRVEMAAKDLIKLS